MLGLDLNYAFSKDFNVGATIMHLSEKSLTEKVNMGDEVLNNTLWGVNLSYNTNFLWLTNLLNKISDCKRNSSFYVGSHGRICPIDDHA